MKKKEFICGRCGIIGKPKIITPGSAGVEILLYLLFCAPGMIYSAWRVSARKYGCSTCGATDMIPLATPRGQALARQFQ